MRINKMNTYCFSLIFYQILSTHSLRKYIEISLESLYVDIGAYRVKCGFAPNWARSVVVPCNLVSSVFFRCKLGCSQFVRECPGNE